MRRWLALAALVAVVAVGAFAATAWVSGGGDEEPAPVDAPLILDHRQPVAANLQRVETR